MRVAPTNCVLPSGGTDTVNRKRCRAATCRSSMRGNSCGVSSSTRRSTRRRSGSIVQRSSRPSASSPLATAGKHRRVGDHVRHDPVALVERVAERGTRSRARPRTRSPCRRRAGAIPTRARMLRVPAERKGMTAEHGAHGEGDGQVQHDDVACRDAAVVDAGPVRDGDRLVADDPAGRRQHDVADRVPHCAVIGDGMDLAADRVAVRVAGERPG